MLTKRLVGRHRRSARALREVAPRAPRGRDAAHREDPRLGDRRRRRPRRAVRAAAARLRRLHGLGPRARRSSRTTSATSVLPLYANTHTEASATGLHTTALREDARGIIHAAVNGGADDVVVFCGSGATGAIDKLVRAARRSISRAPGRLRRPVRAPLQRAAVAGVRRRRRRDPRGRRRARRRRAPGVRARRHAHRRLKIGTFSAASNVTGSSPTSTGSPIALHRHGALSLWDYAARGPYLPIDMNPPADPTATSPTRTPCSSRRTSSSAARERRACSSPSARCSPTRARRCPAAARSCSSARPGTPTTPTRRPRGGRHAGDRRVDPRRPGVRAEGGGRRARRSRRRESDFARRALESWSANPHIEILGNPDLERLAIVSLGLRHPRGHLHANFVVAVLSDLFGIQARSGCFCAGPYIHRMYPIDEQWSSAWTTRSPAATWAPSSPSRD